MKSVGLFIFSIIFSFSALATINVKENQCTKVTGVIKSAILKSGKLYNLVVATKDGDKTIIVFPRTFFPLNPEYQNDVKTAVGATIEAEIDATNKDGVYPCSTATVKASK